MDILILNWKDILHPAAGGAEVVARHLARRLVRDGHRLTFFARSFPGGAAHEVIDGINVIRRGSPLSVYVHAFIWYRRLTVKPDLVIDMVNTLPWFTPWYVPPARRLVYVNQLAQEVFFYRLPWPIAAVAYVGERFLYLPYLTTPAVVFSESTRADLVRLGFTTQRVYRFPLGVDHERYRPGGTKAPDPRFVFVGRLVKMKRADLCLDALKLVAKRYPTVQLVIIGQGPEQARLLAQRRRLRLDRNVRFLTSQLADDREKIQTLQAAWALLLPSVKEGWGMVVTEAAACGTPAIVSNVSGLTDAVIHGQTGLIGSEKPSAKELARLMLTVIEQPQLRARLAEGARQRSLTFDWEVSYQRFKDIVQELGFPLGGAF